MGDVNTSQGVVIATASGDNTLNVSEGLVFAIYNTPTVSIDSSEALVTVIGSQAATLQVSQAMVLAIVRGRIENPKLKAWHFRLDGHTFWCLRLGETKTLVFDLTTKQWSWWSTGGRDTWRANIGLNWESPGPVAEDYGSNVVVGDDTYGVLWVLDPEQGYDNTIVAGDETKLLFTRRATAQIVSRTRNFIPVYQVFLTASPEQPSYDGAAVTLKYSDNGGGSFVNAGSIPVEYDNYVQEFAWRSLGRIQAPGRLFQIEDDGAFARIDGLDILTGS